MSLRISATAALLAVPLAVGRAQQVAWEQFGIRREERFGASLLALPDQDGDGIPELLATARPRIPSQDLQEMRLLSGADLSLRWEVVGTKVRELEYGALASIGDFDGDGVDDFAGANRVLGIVGIHSGADGHMLTKLVDRGFDFATDVIALGDVDGDGDPEVAVSCPSEPRGGVTVGVVRVIACRTDTVLYEVAGTTSESLLGMFGLENLGDLDGDAIADFSVVDFAPVGLGSTVRLISGGSGAELLAIPLDHGYYPTYDLHRIGRAGDQDRDGCPDVAIAGSSPFLYGPSIVIVLSGRDGSELFRVTGPPRTLEAMVEPAGDQDGDGIPELCFGTDDVNGARRVVQLLHGGDGVLLHEMTWDETVPGEDEAATLVADFDLDGDGLFDLVAGSPSRLMNGYLTGVVEVCDWAAGAVRLARHGELTHDEIKGPAAMTGDLDGDGAGDVLIVDGYGPDPKLDSVRLRSGRDGALLAEHPTGVRADGALLGLPDLDGDGRDDYAIALAVNTLAARVECRSSASGAVLASFPSGISGLAWGKVLAVGRQPVSGALELAIGAPDSSSGALEAGEVAFFDLASGALLFHRVGRQVDEEFGSDVAFLGDMNGDGIGDWAAAAPRHDIVRPDSGRIEILSGVDGSQITELRGTGRFEGLGSQVEPIADQDGDGIGDLLATAGGEVRLYAGGSFQELGRFAPEAGDSFGITLRTLGDVNGDGLADWAASGSSPPRVEIRSGATGRSLATLSFPFDPSSSVLQFAEIPAGPAATTNGDAVPDLLVVHPDWIPEGKAALHVLSPAMLTIAPEYAAWKQTVEARLAGGPAGNSTLLQLLEVDGVPDGRVLFVGQFDSVSEWHLSDRVPNGMAGTVWTLRAYAIGWNGRIVASGDQELHFQ